MYFSYLSPLLIDINANVVLILSSCENTISVPRREIFHTEKEKVAIRPACIALSGFYYKMHSLLIRQFPPKNRQGVSFQRRGSTFLSIPDAAPWLPSVAHSVARN